jgi:hypothetical protein
MFRALNAEGRALCGAGQCIPLLTSPCGLYVFQYIICCVHMLYSACTCHTKKLSARTMHAPLSHPPFLPPPPPLPLFFFTYTLSLFRARARALPPLRPTLSLERNWASRVLGHNLSVHGANNLFEYERTPSLDKTPTRPSCLCF